jgi:putative ABC transport system permease protein
MLKQLFKIIWKRKKSNGLIVAEVAIAFMVVFVIMLLAIRNFNLYTKPLGFEYENRWNIRLIAVSGSWEEIIGEDELEQLLLQLKQQDEIENVHRLKNPTFQSWSSTSDYELKGRNIDFMFNVMDDNAPQDFGLELTEGRWFGELDKGLSYEPVIVNQLFIERYFNGENAIGQNISDIKSDNKIEQRIVGVFKDFRQIGELNRLTPYVIYQYKKDKYATRNIEIKLRDGTERSFEEPLMELLTSIAPNWEFTVTPWDVKRENILKQTFLPLLFASVIAAFFILLVALGLFGVLWQNVMSRTPEIGVRRALGATARSIHYQVISELLIVTSLGLFIGLVLVIQLPLSGFIPEISWTLFWSAQLLASLFMLLLAVICAYYPGKMATKLLPADALHYE